MKSPPIEVQFVRQPTANSCVHACLSMVTGVPVEQLIGRFGDRGLGDMQEAIVLTEHGILPVEQSGCGRERFDVFGVYLVTVPSLNHLGKNHRTVWMTDGDEKFVLLDPNAGRVGVAAYPQDCVYDTEGLLKGYSEVTFLRVMPSHYGNEARRFRYSARKVVA